MQGVLFLPESHEEHIADLLSNIKPKESTIQHIKEFLTVYTEFAQEAYLQVLRYINKTISDNPENAKQLAMKVLLDNHNAMKKIKSESDPTSQTKSKALIPEFMPFQVGSSQVELPTHQDPYMVNLYSMCMIAFTIKVKKMYNSNENCSSQTPRF
jgi:hypothetical protein